MRCSLSACFFFRPASPGYEVFNIYFRAGEGVFDEDVVVVAAVFIEFSSVSFSVFVDVVHFLLFCHRFRGSYLLSRCCQLPKLQCIAFRFGKVFVLFSPQVFFSCFSCVSHIRGMCVNDYEGLSFYFRFDVHCRYSFIAAFDFCNVSVGVSFYRYCHSPPFPSLFCIFGYYGPCSRLHLRYLHYRRLLFPDI